MKNCRSKNYSLLLPSRAVFFNPGEGPKEDVGAKVEGPKKSAEQVVAEAKVALEDAKAERGNIESYFGKPDKAGKLPKGTPDAIQEQYTKLGETITKLENAQKKPQAVVESTLAQVDDIFAKLDSASKSKEVAGVPLDPLQGITYTPKVRSAKPDVEADKAAKVDAGKKVEDKPAKKVNEKAEASEKEFQAVLALLERVEAGATELTADEKTLLKGYLKPGELYLAEGKNGTSYDAELSKDKKWVRINVDLQPKEGLKRESLTRVFPLEDKLTGKQPEFKFKTREERESKALAENTKALEEQITWLESKDAPLGSTVIIRSEQVTRKNAETKEDETVLVATGIRKGTDGLRIVHLESSTNDKGEQVIKEVKSEPYKKESAMAMASEKGKPAQVEGSAKEKKDELKRGMDYLSHTLMANYTVGGESGKGFQDTLSAMKKLITEYNIGKFTHKDTIVGYLVKVDDGKISILDPAKKNPNYKSPEETPGEQKYAAKFGPKEVSSIA